MILKFKIWIIEFAMSIFENSEECWSKRDYEMYADLQRRLKKYKRE